MRRVRLLLVATACLTNSTAALGLSGRSALAFRSSATTLDGVVNSSRPISYGLLLTIKIPEPDLVIAFSPLDMKFGGYDCDRLVAGRLFFGGSSIRGVHFVCSQLLTTH